MEIRGLQKTSLLDFPGHLSCTVFTGGCNLRCPFCHNSSLVLRPQDEPAVTEEEIFTHLKKRKGIIDGVTITGGEPLLWNDIGAFIKKLKDMELFVKLDTNGTFPDKLKELIPYIDYVAMDIKNSKAKYPETVGIKDFDTTNVSRSVDILINGEIDYEFRTTVVKEFHENKDFEDIGKWLAGADKYFLQGFIDSGDLIKEGLHAHSPKMMKVFKETVSPYIKTVSIRGVD